MSLLIFKVCIGCNKVGYWQATVAEDVEGTCGVVLGRMVAISRVLHCAVVDVLCATLCGRHCAWKGCEGHVVGKGEVPCHARV